MLRIGDKRDGAISKQIDYDLFWNVPGRGFFIEFVQYFQTKIQER
jgi:hypothetical protein